MRHDDGSCSGTRTISLRRPHIVWATLAVSMTIVGGALLLSERGGRRPSPPPALVAQPTRAYDIGDIFALPTPIRGEASESDPWLGVVVHHSAATSGSHDSLDQLHREQGLDGLGYHFVIGNGRGAPDGGITVGERWQRQRSGAHTAGPDADHYNVHYVGICLVGDGDRRPFSDAQLASLVSLVRALQGRLGLDAGDVVLHRDVASTASPGRLFPRSWFRAQLEGPGLASR
jgi:hypothetical protein